MFASNHPKRDRKPKYISKIWTKHGSGSKRWPLTPFPFLAPWPCRPPAMILVLCLLCVTLLVCSFYSSFAPSSNFFSSWWQRDRELFTHTLVFQGSPSTSSRQPQTIHVFADRRIGLLRHALRICVAHATPESCSSFLLQRFVHWAFRACCRNRFPLLHHAFLPKN